MRIYLDHVGILEIFADAQGLVVQQPEVFAGFVFPQKGKSGLSRSSKRAPGEKRYSTAEARAAHSADVVERRRRAIAKDPTYREREQAKSRERVRKWRAGKKAKR